MHADQPLLHWYGNGMGRSITERRHSRNIRNIRLVDDFINETSRKFYYDDVTDTSYRRRRRWCLIR